MPVCCQCSMQWSTPSGSRHLAKTAERPHSSYTRPSSAVRRAQQNQLRRRSISEPGKLHIDLDSHSQLFQPPGNPAVPPGGHGPAASAVAPVSRRPQKRPQSAMPRLQTGLLERPQSGQQRKGELLWYWYCFMQHYKNYYNHCAVNCGKNGYLPSKAEREMGKWLFITLVFRNQQ